MLTCVCWGENSASPSRRIQLGMAAGSSWGWPRTRSLGLSLAPVYGQGSGGGQAAGSPGAQSPRLRLRPQGPGRRAPSLRAPGPERSLTSRASGRGLNCFPALEERRRALSQARGFVNTQTKCAHWQRRPACPSVWCRRGWGAGGRAKWPRLNVAGTPKVRMTTTVPHPECWTWGLSIAPAATSCSRSS